MVSRQINLSDCIIEAEQVVLGGIEATPSLEGSISSENQPDQEINIGSDVILANLQSSCLNQHFNVKKTIEKPPYYYEKFLMECNLDPSKKLEEDPSFCLVKWNEFLAVSQS